MFLCIFHIVIETSDEDVLAGLVTGEAYVHPEAVHHLGDGLASRTNQTTVHAMVDEDLVGDLLILGGKEWRGGRGGRE